MLSLLQQFRHSDRITAVAEMTRSSCWIFILAGRNICPHLLILGLITCISAENIRILSCNSKWNLKMYFSTRKDSALSFFSALELI